MKYQKTPPYIRNSRKYYGKFEVVVSKNDIIPCYNLATARSVLFDIKSRQ